MLRKKRKKIASHKLWNLQYMSLVFSFQRRNTELEISLPKRLPLKSKHLHRGRPKPLFPAIFLQAKILSMAYSYNTCHWSSFPSFNLPSAQLVGSSCTETLNFDPLIIPSLCIYASLHKCWKQWMLPGLTPIQLDKALFSVSLPCHWAQRELQNDLHHLI